MTSNAFNKTPYIRCSECGGQYAELLRFMAPTLKCPTCGTPHQIHLGQSEPDGCGPDPIVALWSSAAWSIATTAAVMLQWSEACNNWCSVFAPWLVRVVR